MISLCKQQSTLNFVEFCFVVLFVCLFVCLFFSAIWSASMAYSFSPTYSEDLKFYPDDDQHALI